MWAAISKPPLTRRWTYATRSKLRQNGQTSAHAEMDLRPLRPHSVSVSNLRSRGDGPDTRLAFGHSVSKPPLTRRWTILPCLMLNTFSQTSAHAEMDLLDTTYTDLYRPNLRSRGDGPAVIVQHSADHGKPPLTRRWTYRALPSGRARFQTSAHAEMDPLPESWHFKDAPNLRSRGDGPRAGDTDQNLQTKPPLTRRWTQAPFARAFFILQTSAHAEMDLPCLPSGPCGPANLRSRGDEPQMHDADGR